MTHVDVPGSAHWIFLFDILDGLRSSIRINCRVPKQVQNSNKAKAAIYVMDVTENQNNLRICGVTNISDSETKIHEEVQCQVVE